MLVRSVCLFLSPSVLTFWHLLALLQLFRWSSKRSSGSLCTRSRCSALTRTSPRTGSRSRPPVSPSGRTRSCSQPPRSVSSPVCCHCGLLPHRLFAGRRACVPGHCNARGDRRAGPLGHRQTRRAGALAGRAVSGSCLFVRAHRVSSGRVVVLCDPPVSVLPQPVHDRWRLDLHHLENRPGREFMRTIP